MRRPGPIQPDRLRQMERPFGWIPFRIVSSGLLGRLSTQAKLLYFVLCVLADRDGLSFWGDRRLGQLLQLSREQLEQARLELCRRELLAFDGWLYQLLSLPTALDGQPPMPAANRRIQLRTKSRAARLLGTRGAGGLETAREILERLLPEVRHAH